MGAVINIPAGLNFAEIVAKKLLKSYPENPLEIADITVWVPAPRQAQVIKNAIIKLAPTATILPKIMPLRLPENVPEIASAIPKNTQEISAIKRQAVLTKLVMGKDKKLSYAAAWELATELANLMDKLNVRGISFQNLETLVSSQFAKHWQRNLDFLKIILKVYPKWLKEENGIDTATINHKRLLKLAEFYSKAKQPLNVWAVGFADTTIAGLEVLKAIHSMPNSHIVLPDWQGQIDTNLPPTHPQHSLQNLVAKVGINSADIMQIKPLKTISQNVTIIEASSFQTEAQTIALSMRESAEEEKNCALITPDRNLSKQVQAELLRWSIQVDDSAGKPLTQTLETGFLLNIANTVATKLAPIPLAELIKHPLCNGGKSTADWKNITQELEKNILRGVAPNSGFYGLRKRWQANKNPVASQGIDILANALQELTNLGFEFSISTYVKALVNAADLLNVNNNKELNWTTESLQKALFEWEKISDLAGSFNLQSAAEALTSMLTKITIHSPATHSKLFIWGPLEARLQACDKIIIGGLNEGVWPKTPPQNSWLNTAMQKQLSLPNPERVIGLAAHDLSQFLAHENLTITRSLQTVDGEAAQSRFLNRWKNKVGTKVVKEAKNRGEKYLQWVAEINSFGSGNPAKPANVNVPKNARPTKLSASTISDLMSCPFKAYGKKILHLQHLPEFLELPDAADKGTLVHTWLQAFFKQVESYKPPFTEPVTPKNSASAQKHLAQLADELCAQLPEFSKAIWQARLHKLIPEIVQEFIRLNTENTKPIEWEKKGKAIINETTIFAIADRVDISPNGVILVDYKTGTPPKDKEIVMGTNPQLAVEAWLQHKQGFGNKKPVAGMQVLEIGMGNSKGVVSHDFTHERLEKKLPNWLNETEKGLQNLVNNYAKKEAIYTAVPSKNNCQYCDFSGLCRKAEWEDKTNE